MFVSSYSTYIGTNNTQRVDKERVEHSKSSSASFKSVLAKETIVEPNNPNLPINYVSNFKAFSNKQKLQEKLDNQDTLKYSKMKKLKNAQTAYEDNSKIFSLILKPKLTLGQTLPQENRLSNDLQETQQQTMRHKMVNTYISNDNYYKITA